MRAPQANPVEILKRAFQLNAEGRPDDAMQLVKPLFKAYPKHPTVLYLMGVIHHRKGETDKAATFFRKAWTADKTNVGAVSGLGLIALDKERFAEASDRFREAIRINPRDASLYNNLGLALKGMKQYGEAEEAFLTALDLQPDAIETHQNIARVLAQIGDMERAGVHLKTVLDSGRAEARDLVDYGSVLRVMGDTDEAMAFYRRAIEMDPAMAEAHLHLGSVLETRGDFGEAEQEYRAAIEIDPESLTARLELGVLLSSTDREEEAEAIFDEVLKDSRISKNLDAIAPNVSYRIGKALDQLKRHEEAFPFFLNAHAQWKAILDSSGRGYALADQEAAFDRIINVFSGIEPGSIRGSDSKRPVFIVGMPRSGTSLLEQVLASHPDIYGAGELPIVTDLARSLSAEEGLWPDGIAAVGAEGIAERAERYLAEIAKLDDKARFVTDKMPANHVYTGLIRLMFPEALIIHSRRNPMDTCLSVFMQKFGSEMRFDHDLMDIAHYYGQYRRLMDFWHRWDPSILTVDYELMVADLETQARALIDRLGLEWDDRCLEFHKTKREVRTASRLQVRKPIYNSSVERWRRYGDHLIPLKDALGKLADPFVAFD